MNHVCIISGPAAARALVEQAIGREGLTVTEAAGHGLPSHTDPVTAHAAGAPNSGHQVDGEHPETGEAYEDDPSVAFLRVQADDPDRVVALVEDRGWQLRAHGIVVNAPEPTVEEHLAAIDAHLELIRGLRS